MIFFLGGGVGGVGLGVRVDMNGEVKFFVNIQKQFWGSGGGSDQGLGGGGGGVARFGVGG